MKETLKFEEAYKELGEIVKKLEKGNLPLEEAKIAFERGSVLSKFCYSEVEKAAGKIKVIREELDKLVEEDEGR